MVVSERPGSPPAAPPPVLWSEPRMAIVWGPPLLLGNSLSERSSVGVLMSAAMSSTKWMIDAEVAPAKEKTMITVASMKRHQ